MCRKRVAFKSQNPDSREQVDTGGCVKERAASVGFPTCVTVIETEFNCCASHKMSSCCRRIRRVDILLALAVMTVVFLLVTGALMSALARSGQPRMATRICPNDVAHFLGVFPEDRTSRIVSAAAEAPAFLANVVSTTSPTKFTIADLLG